MTMSRNQISNFKHCDTQNAVCFHKIEANYPFPVIKLRHFDKVRRNWPTTVKFYGDSNLPKFNLKTKTFNSYLVPPMDRCRCYKPKWRKWVILWFNGSPVDDPSPAQPRGARRGLLELSEEGVYETRHAVAYLYDAARLDLVGCKRNAIDGDNTDADSENR